MKCQIVLVKFKDKNLPMQEIHNREANGASILDVSRDSQFLTVMHLTAQGRAVKQINFNIDDLKEYACEGVQELFFVDKGFPGYSRADLGLTGK